MHLIASFVLALLFVAAPVAADVRLVTRKLPNGMVIVLAPEVRGEGIAVHLTFDAGSRHDGAKAHGTAWVASRVVGGRLAGFKADVNQERAIFTATVAGADLSGLQAIRRPLASEEFLQARTGLTADTAAQQELLRLVYGKGPYGHPAQMAPTNVRQKDVERFLERHYGASSAVIALAGTFDDDVVMATLVSTFGSLRSTGPRQRCRPERRRLSREARREIGASAAQREEIHIGYPTVPSSDPDWYALNILADAIGQGPESRLQAALVGRGLAADFGEGEAESPCGASLLRMRVRVAPKVPIDAVMAAMDAELRRLAAEGITAGELAVAREQERQWSESQLSTPAGVASAAARAVLFYADEQRVNAELGRMLAVSAGDVQRVAKKYLQPSNRAVVVVKPTAPAPTPE